MTVADRPEPTIGIAFRNEVLTGGCLAILTSTGPITTLCYAALGISGNTVFTGLLLVSILGIILTLGSRTNISIGAADYLFLAFVLCAAVSVAINGATANAKEFEIFAVSLAAYPVCRFSSLAQLRNARPAFMGMIGLIVAIGTIVTAWALITQWDDMHGKPIIGGFDAGATMLLGSLGFLLIAVSTMPLAWRKTAIISGFIFLPVVIFAASQVRFTFAAILGSLCLAAILAHAKERKYIMTIVLVIASSMAIGLAARHGTTKTFMVYATEVNQPKPGSELAQLEEIRSPSCYLNINQFNSVAQRKALILDALYLIPSAGAFGSGLDSFADLSCMKMSAHNSALQAFVEFGWFGGAALALLVTLSLFTLLPAAHRNQDARFILCSLAYIVAISLAHGRTSRDIVLFSLLGLAAGIPKTIRAQL